MPCLRDLFMQGTYLPSPPSACPSLSACRIDEGRKYNAYRFLSLLMRPICHERRNASYTRNFDVFLRKKIGLAEVNERNIRKSHSQNLILIEFQITLPRMRTTTRRGRPRPAASTTRSVPTRAASAISLTLWASVTPAAIIQYR